MFQTWPQVHDQKSCSPGDQPQNGQRIRGPEGFVLLSWRGVISVPDFGMTALGECEGQTPLRSILRQRRGQRRDCRSKFAERSFQFAQRIRSIAEPAVPADGFQIERRPVRLSGSERPYTSFQAVSGKFQCCSVAILNGLLDSIQHFRTVIEKKLGNFL